MNLVHEQTRFKGRPIAALFLFTLAGGCTVPLVDSTPTSVDNPIPVEGVVVDASEIQDPETRLDDLPTDTDRDGLLDQTIVLVRSNSTQEMIAHALIAKNFLFEANAETYRFVGEDEVGTNPYVYDSDFDGIPDSVEERLRTNPEECAKFNVECPRNGIRDNILIGYDHGEKKRPTDAEFERVRTFWGRHGIQFQFADLGTIAYDPFWTRDIRFASEIGWHTVALFGSEGSPMPVAAANPGGGMVVNTGPYKSLDEDGGVDFAIAIVHEGMHHAIWELDPESQTSCRGPYGGPVHSNDPTDLLYVSDDCTRHGQQNETLPGDHLGERTRTELQRSHFWVFEALYNDLAKKEA